METEMRKTIMLGTFAVLVMLAGAATAAEIEVKMLNKSTAGVMVFEPSLIKVVPGDTVKFVATDKSHNAESISGMLPDGATAFKGKINQDVAVTFDRPGVYGVKCLPHYGMGMVALVVVGDPTNQDAAKAVVHPGRAKKVFADLFGQVPARTAAK
jgi:pseudoazurin